MADANVYIRYLADASKLVGESKRAGRSVDKVGGSAKRANKQMSGFASSTVKFFAGTAVAAGMAMFVNEGIKMADTADLIRVSWEKTFGAAGGRLVSNLEDQRKALGLAEFEMQQLLGTTGQLAQQQGMTKDESAEFAEQLFIMAGDVAAFTGELDQAPRVLGAFQAAIRGEFDPLEQFGIKLSQAAINNKALEMTGKAAVSELTDQEKQTALLALITEALADETGALGEAMQSGATDANELSAEMKDAQEGIGQVGQVLKRALNTGLLKAIELLKALGVWIGETMLKMQAWGNNTSGVLGAIVRFFSDLLQAMWGVGGGAERMAQRFRNAFNSILSPIRTVSSAVSRLSGKVGSVIGRIRSIRIPGFATGGIVGGQTGAPSLAVVHGGERVQTPAQQRGDQGGGGAVYNISVSAGLANPNETAMAIVDLLRQYQRTQGDIPFSNNATGQAP